MVASPPVAPVTAATTGQPASAPLARAAETACAAKPCPIVRIVTKPSISGVYRHEPVSQHLLVIENRLARIFRLPRATGVVGVVGIAAAERFVAVARRSEEHTSELQSLMRISYAVFCLKKTKS